MRLPTLLALPLTLIPLLACGGLAGPPVADRTARLCTHLEAEHEAPCTPAPFGAPVVVGDLRIRAVEVSAYAGGKPASFEERQALGRANGNAVAVVLELTNDAPVKVPHDFGVSLHTSDGELRMVGPGASATFARRHGIEDAFSLGYVKPGATARVAYVVPVPVGEMSGAVLQLWRTERKPDPRDPRGRMRTFVVEQALLELPTVSPPML